MSMCFGVGFALRILVPRVVSACSVGPRRLRLGLRWGFALLSLTSALLLPGPASAERCGGTERWYVKVGTDPRASEVDLAHPSDLTVAALNALPKLQGTVPHGDDRARLDEETKLYTVSGFLALFKDEDDDDYHLVITDASLRYTAGGQASAGQETGTSFIAEIVDPDCVAGKKGQLGTPSVFQAQLASARQQFEARFPQGKGADQFLGIPVTVTGVAFYDRPHYQTGRAVNGMELHPVLDITFGAAPVQPLATTAGTELLTNAGFEGGPNGWSGTTSAVGEYVDVAAHGGQQVCWLGGYGRKKSETIAQLVAIPDATGQVRLSFWVDISTEEVTTSKAYDKCQVQVRSAGGQVLTTLETLSNLNETGDYLQKTYDLTAYKGRDVQIYLKASEDSDRATSFILDDFSVELR